MCKHKHHIKNKCDCNHHKVTRGRKHIDRGVGWRRFSSSDEKREELEEYKKELEEELKAVNERLNKI